MKASKILLTLAVAAAFLLVQPVKAEQRVQAGPTYYGVHSVPDAGSTLTLLGCGLFAVAALRRKIKSR